MHKKKIGYFFVLPILLPLLICLILFSLFIAVLSPKDALAASASTSEKLRELLHLKQYGIPHDIVMMLATYPCKTQQEADRARYVNIALDFTIFEEEKYIFVCICPPPEPTDENPYPELVCICDNWEYEGSSIYTGRTDILSYIGSHEEDTSLNCFNFGERIYDTAASKCQPKEVKYIITYIGAVSPSEYPEIIKKNGVVKAKEIEAILNYHEDGYYIQWIEDAAKSMGMDSGNTEIPPIISEGFMMPVSGPITSAFGYRIHPITGKQNFHTGVDIGSAWHANIVSVSEGKVVAVGTDPYDGRYIKIYHENKGMSFYSYYGHLSQWGVSVGDEVKMGETIGIEGGQPGTDPDVGYSTGHHLHFEIIVNGKEVDPLVFIRGGGEKDVQV